MIYLQVQGKLILWVSCHIGKESWSYDPLSFICSYSLNGQQMLNVSLKSIRSVFFLPNAEMEKRNNKVENTRMKQLK